MHKRYLLAAYRLFFGSIAIVAVVAQLQYGLERPSFDLANFFSFFTIQSNVVAAILFVMAGFLTLRGRQSLSLDMLRGGATLYMAATGVVYVLLLSGLEASLQTPIPWVNFILHYLMPAAVVLDWCIDLPKRPMRLVPALLWLTYPAIYLLYTLVRGHFVSWYPYPFLNPVESGYPTVIVASIIIALGMVGFTWLIVRSTRLKNNKNESRT